jgi:hypothetical protein
MRTTIVILYLVSIFFAPLQSASAYSIWYNGAETDVGNIDSFQTSASIGNSEDAELTWVNTTLPLEMTFLAKTEAGDADWVWYNVLNTEGIFAFALKNNAQYFSLKIGNGVASLLPSTNDRYLFENIDSLEWAVIDMRDMGFSGTGGPVNWNNVTSISHVSEFSPVPEPATMLLFGSGILGLAAVARRKKR